MKIAHVTAPGRGTTNRLLSELASALAARGLRLAGTVQTDTETPRSVRCDMDLRVLPDGPVLRISQSLGPSAEGCRLDPSALEQGVALSLERVMAGADLVIINKFGKQEASGRGFREVIGEALARDIPVLVGVNATTRPLLEAFCDGQATALPPQHKALLDWALAEH